MQTKFAPIVPPPLLQTLFRAPPHIRGDLHLLLAHEVLNPRFKEIYRSIFQGRKVLDVKVILDNGAAELGESLSGEKLLEAAEIVNPNIVVVPDAMGDATSTLMLADEFYNQYAWRFNRLAPSRGLVDFMIVPQGKTLEVFTKCLDGLSIIFGSKHVAVPRSFGNLHGTRQQVIDIILILKPAASIHLLGFSDNLMDDIACARRPQVTGIDSCVPFLAGSIKVSLHLEGDFVRPTRPPQEFWDSEVLKSWTPEVVRNILRVRKWIGEIT